MSILQRILSIFGGMVPGGEEAATTLELGEKIKSMIDAYRRRELTVELRTQIQQTGGDKLDEFYTSQAEEQFEAHLGSYIREKNIPDAIVQPARDKAIEQMVGILRGQYDKYTEAAPAGNPS